MQCRCSISARDHLVYYRTYLTQRGHKYQKNLKYTLGIIWEVFYTEFQKCETRTCPRFIFLKGRRKGIKNTTELLKISHTYL